MSFANSYTMSYLLPLSSLATVTFAQCLGGIEYKLSSYTRGPKSISTNYEGVPKNRVDGEVVSSKSIGYIQNLPTKNPLPNA